MKTCRTEGCGRSSASSAGYCSNHYKRAKHRGELPNSVPCPKEGCPWFQAKAGLCLNCYEARKRATPEGKAYTKEYKKKYLANPENYKKHREWFRKYERDLYWNRGLREKKQAYYSDPNVKPMYAARTAKRRARKLQATPAWANLEVIKEIYLNCPEGHHVDHIVPLQGKNVCGLHVEYNLQYLPASENMSKGNKFDEADERKAS